MRGESAKSGRTNYRRRMVSVATGAGAIALVAVMAMSSMASAGFPGATWTPFTYKDSEGCATAKGFPAHWAAATGHGKDKLSTSAVTCPAYRGGDKTFSLGDAFGELTVTAPVHLPTGTGGVNVSWSIVGTATDSGGFTGSGACPTVYYNGSYNYGYTWYNYSDAQADCYAYAEVSLYGEAYLMDLTTNTAFYPSNYWNLYNTSGNENFSYTDTATYSNSSYWIYNYSYSYANNYSYGPSGALAGNMAPQWFINGTFSHSDQYNVITYLEPSTVSEVNGFTHGHAASSVNFATGPNHEDLLPFSIW
jgi:hypothetical protein